MSDFHNSIYLKYKDNPEISMLALSTDPQLQTMKFLLGVETSGMPIAYGANNIASPHYNMWESETSISPFPLDVIIDKAGKIVKVLREYEPAVILSEINRLTGGLSVHPTGRLLKPEGEVKISHQGGTTQLHVGPIRNKANFTLTDLKGRKISPISSRAGILVFFRLTAGVYLYSTGKTAGKIIIPEQKE